MPFFSNVYFLGTDYSQVPEGGWGGGERYVEALNWLAQQNQEKNKILTSNQYQWFLPLCGKLIKVLQ